MKLITGIPLTPRGWDQRKGCKVREWGKKDQQQEHLSSLYFSWTQGGARWLLSQINILLKALYLCLMKKFCVSWKNSTLNVGEVDCFQFSHPQLSLVISFCNSSHREVESICVGQDLLWPTQYGRSDTVRGSSLRVLGTLPWDCHQRGHVAGNQGAPDKAQPGLVLSSFTS